MLTKESRIFIQRPDEAAQRILHAATVLAATDNIYAIRPAESDLAFEAGDELRIFFEKDRKFMQQAGRVEALMDPPPDDTDESQASPQDAAPILGVATVGEPASAESRECYRVLTMFTDMTVCVGDEDQCPLLDVSATGFAVVSSQELLVGQIVDVSPHHDGQSFPGQASVQSVRDLGAGRFRYGMHCTDERGGDRTLVNGLQQISAAVQRQQLRRMAGKAG